MKLLGNRKKGLLFVLSAPAGTGKTTLVKRLFSEFPEVVVPSITCTTRKPRPGEANGVDYHFISEEEFSRKIKENHFLEYVQIFDRFYGTLREDVKSQLNKGQHVVLVIDTQGAEVIKTLLPCIRIFLMPPSLEALEERLKRRATERDEEAKQRLSLAEKEISAAKKYDYVIVNEDLEIAYQVLLSIIIAEEHKVSI